MWPGAEAPCWPLAVFPAAIDCVVGPWGPWSACTSSCGVGSTERSRQVSVPPRNGGRPCPDLKQRRGCFGNDAVCSRGTGEERRAFVHGHAVGMNSGPHSFGLLLSSGVPLRLLGNTSVLKPVPAALFQNSQWCRSQKKSQNSQINASEKKKKLKYEVILDSWHRLLEVCFDWRPLILTPDLQRWRRSCPIRSRGTSRTLGGDHTWWWRRRRKGKTFHCKPPHPANQPFSFALSHVWTTPRGRDLALLCLRRTR